MRGGRRTGDLGHQLIEPHSGSLDPLAHGGQLRILQGEPAAQILILRAQTMNHLRQFTDAFSQGVELFIHEGDGSTGPRGRAWLAVKSGTHANA